jgi:hypothetical protein
MAYIHRQVKMIAPVDSMQGMIGKQSDNICQKAIIFNLRTARSCTNDGKPFQYFSVRSKVGIKQTASQRAWCAKFAQIANGTRDRMQDPQYVAADKAAFATQSKYKTLYSYVFHQVKANLN